MKVKDQEALELLRKINKKFTPGTYVRFIDISPTILQPKHELCLEPTEAGCYRLDVVANVSKSYSINKHNLYTFFWAKDLTSLKRKLLKLFNLPVYLNKQELLEAHPEDPLVLKLITD